jgi:hypothetical protein
MAIADTTLLLEGQRDFSGGMDSSKAPNLIAPNTVSRSVNVTFRGGTPTTRPGFNQLVLANATTNANEGLDYFVNGLFQGSYFYQDRREGKSPCLFCVMSGNVVKVDLGTYEVQRVFPIVAAPDIASGQSYEIITVGTTNWMTYGASANTTGVVFTSNTTVGAGTGAVYARSPIDMYADCYFVQCENFLIIQDGINLPRIWDGDNLWISTLGPRKTYGQATNSIGAIAEVPIGTVMAYGQGRLFVANTDRTSGTAGDLAYGGSTDQITIATGAGVSGAATYEITTSGDHGFSTDDYVTISGHSSSNGINGTWKITVTTTTKFTIAAANPSSTTSGTGGYVAKANAGSASDLLRFTETTYLDEGGSLQVPSFLGKITGMIFMPVQDVGSGQGDLLVFCETGVISLSVAVPRSEWKLTVGFQRIALASVGSTGQESLATANGDVFFRSFDGLRTYRNARAEFNSFGRVPISAEMNGVLNYDTKSMLKNCSSIVFDNRFLFTATPQISYTNVSNSQLTKRPITFSTIVALDFTTLASIGAQRASCYDGMWRGLDVTKLVTGVVAGKPRAFAFCIDYAVNATNTIWELSSDNYDDQPVNSEAVPITSILETRSFQLGSPAEVKKLIRADLWLGSLRGTTDFKVYWRPDEYACWRDWHEFSRCATVNNCVATGVGTEFNATSSTVTIGFYTSTIKWYRISVASPGGSTYTKPLQFMNSDNATADCLVIANALTVAGIVFTTVTRSGTYPVIAYSIAGAGSDFTIIPVKTPGPNGTANCEDMFAPKNLQPQYRPQVRMPTPPADADPVVGRPYYFGNDFQFRIEWTGHAQLTRFLALGQRQLEQYQGTDYVEVV